MAMSLDRKVELISTLAGETAKLQFGLCFDNKEHIASAITELEGICAILKREADLVTVDDEGFEEDGDELNSARYRRNRW